MKTIEDYNTLVKTYIDTKDNAKAPTDHSSTATTYGVGSTTKYGHVKVDDALSASSTNPVQNKKVYELKQALSNEVVTRSELGAHNLLPNELQTQTVNGITFTRYDDGSFKANGTNSNANAGIDIFLNSESPIKPPAGNYVVSTENNIASTNSKLIAFAVMRYNNGVVGESIISIGNGANSANFTVDYNGYDAIGIKLWFQGGCSVSDLIIKPMIRMAEDSDTTYRPYVPTNSQLLSYKDNGVLGAKSLHPLLLSTTTTSAGVTFTVNNDDTVTLSGTGSSFSLVRAGYAVLKKGTYKISGNAIESSDPNADYALSVRDENDTILGSTVINPIFTLSEDTNCRFVFYVKGGINTAGKVFKPMIRLATDTDPTYQPYAMTNKELTDELKYYSVDLTAVSNSIATRKGCMENVCTQLDSIISTTDIDKIFLGSVDWTGKKSFKVIAKRESASEIHTTLISSDNLILNGMKSGSTVTCYSFEGTTES